MSILETFTASMTRAGSHLAKALGSDTVIVPLVRMEGMIAAGGRNQSALNLARVEKLLDKAFAFEDAPAVAISINSPGGSPVQSRLICERIRALAEEKEKPVLVFCEDLAASGGYMIACAGDEIFADPASVVGSIGVISASFGFTGAMERLGVERRIKTAGESKVLSDPFSEETEAQKERMERLLEAVHKQFIALVKARRGDKLNDDLARFDGTIYTGEEAVEAGLIDGLGEARATLRERFGDKTRIKLLAPSRGGLLARFTASAVDVIEARTAWDRFSL
ncbi:MAG: S49 family peptidase [Alphaproteobacteria bacterium]|nr:S49 family peptidase [Alphaproteobacteria bacterium]